MSGSPESTEPILELLSNTIPRITALTADLTDTQLHTAPHGSSTGRMVAERDPGASALEW